MPEEALEPIPAAEATPTPVPEATVSQQEQSPMLERERPVEAKVEQKSERMSQILSKVKSVGAQRTSDDEVDADAAQAGTQADAEQKVHVLVEMAQLKGVAHAVRVAKRMNDLYVLDMTHDELADKLYEGLLAKGLIDKE